jgi:hypothetical protein
MSDFNEDSGGSGNEPIEQTLGEGTPLTVPEHSLSRAIEQSRRLIRESQRIITESYKFEPQKY